MGQFGKIGTSVSPARITRTKGSKDYIGRGVFLSENYLCKAVAYDPVVKCMVDLDRTSAARYHLQPVVYYYFLLARFTNVTSTGGPLSGDFVVEYARMTSGQYETFLGLTRNMETFPGVVSIEYTEKMSDNGKNMSYTYFVPYMRPMDPSLLIGIKRLSSDAEAIKGLWGIVDSETGLSVSQYEQKLLEAKEQSSRALPGVGAPAGYVGVGSGAPMGDSMYSGGSSAPAYGGGVPQPMGSPSGYGGGVQSAPQPMGVPQPAGGAPVVGSHPHTAAPVPGAAPTFGGSAPTFGSPAPTFGGGMPQPAGGAPVGAAPAGGAMYVERGAPVMPNGPLGDMAGPVSGVQEFANFEDMGQGDLPF